MDLHQTETTAAAAGRAAAPAPRLGLYYVHPLSAGALRTWPALLDRVAEMGFAGIVLAPPFAAASVLLADRLDAPHPALEWTGDAASALQFLDSACRARNLVWLLDVVLDRVAADGALAASAGQFYAVPGAAVVDPRLGTPAALARPEAALELAAWWATRLAGWARAGAAGFRLLGLGAIPPTAVAALSAAVREAAPGRTLIGWTEELSGAALARLAQCGLDRTSLVLAGWDFAAEWVWERMAALRAVAPPLVCVEAPFGPRVAAGIADPALVGRALGRLAGTATALADAWMMPMGFEGGAIDALDPRRGAPEDLAVDAGLAAVIRAAQARPGPSGAMRPVAASGLAVTAFAPAAPEPDGLVLVNPDLARERTVSLGGVAAALGRAAPETLELAPGAVRHVSLTSIQPIRVTLPARAGSATTAAATPRVALERIEPAVDSGRFAAKRVAGETAVVEADVLCDGHDKLSAVLQYRAADETAWRETRMVALGNDRWQGRFALGRPGRWLFRVQAWRDAFATYRDELAKKSAAGVDIHLELIEGLQAIQAAGAHDARIGVAAKAIAGAPAEERARALLAPDLAALMAEADPRPLAVTSEAHPIDADRSGAAFASWYEIFPRSMSDDAARHGTFRDVIRHLPRIRDMGFDVLYFPPIHPIGRTNRKGRNNSLEPAADDPGSPYAIGAEAGGHDAIHPELGSFEDFRALREAAEAHGLEIALDFAIQCAPDHPWLRQHKGWFAWRPDGSMKYAENPPKKYQDIVNVDFYAPDAIPGLWVALCEVVLFWAEQGVRTFRVDNPHTKPLPFWEWLIGQVRGPYPDAVFLAEAFTRPKIMNRLAKLGFTQSYTYFTWRNTRREIEEYLTELSSSDQRDYFRPNFFVNTPDINPPFLQTGGRAAHLIRATLAATLSGLWGVYSGFELCEATPLPGREEYLDSEKYQLRAWDWDRPGNIVAEITRLNLIRRRNPALRTHLGVTFLPCDNDQVIFFEKATPERDNVLLVAISLDPARGQSAGVELPLWRWPLPDQASLACEDLLGETRFTLAGKWQRVTLTPEAPAVIWRARPAL